MKDAIDYIKQANSSWYPLITKEFSSQSSKMYNNQKFTLYELDEWRHDYLPEKLYERYRRTGETWLKKDELTLLMDWKLAKGKFRPILPKLIKSNEENTVKDITLAGFHIFLSYIKDLDTSNFWNKEKNRKGYVEIIKKSFKKLCELRGVGPATASLILSLTTKINTKLAPPFLSDESFIYYVIEPFRPDTKMKYNVKEYTDELLPNYFKILKKNDDLNMSALERGGWSIKTFDLYKIDKLHDLSDSVVIEPEFLSKFKYDPYPDVKDTEKEENEDVEKRSLRKKRQKI